MYFIVIPNLRMRYDVHSYLMEYLCNSRQIIYETDFYFYFDYYIRQCLIIVEILHERCVKLLKFGFSLILF